METKGNYAAVGAFVVLLFFGALAFVIWIGKAELRNYPDVYAIYFGGSVSGLKDGAQVLYRGVPVGTVQNISIDPDNVEKVLVLVDIKKGTPIKADAVATLEMQGVTGLSIVQISGGTIESPPLAQDPGQKYPVIPSKSSVVEALFASTPELLARLNDVLNKTNRQNLGKILDNMATLLSNANETTMKLSSFLEAAQQSLKSMQVNLEGTVNSFATFSSDIAEMVHENKDALNDFFTNGLFEFTRLVAQMRNTFETINKLASGVERDPLTFLTGSPEKGYKLHGTE